MEHASHIQFDTTQLNIIGNTIIYLCERTPKLSKIKLLPLLYILDELSIKKSGIPFLNLKYHVWTCGPVPAELINSIYAEAKLLDDFITIHPSEDIHTLLPKTAFNDDEFSDNDIDLMEFVVKNFGRLNAAELMEYTKRKNGPWHNTAREKNVLDLMEKEIQDNTEYTIDMGQLISQDLRKTKIYMDFNCHA